MHPFQQFLPAGFAQVADDTWASDDRVIVQPVFFNLVPDLPAALTDPGALQRGMTQIAARDGGAVVEADVVTLGGQPALRQIVKVKLQNQPTGLAFLGSFIVPKATCSAVLRVQAAEQGTTGIREAIVMSRRGPDDMFRPHPYWPDGTTALPFSMADSPAYDAEFPQHPLSRVRQVMAQLAAQVTLDPRFAALPPFAV
ncbi:MAG: hypothetical protein HOV79_02785 [Hamadaea sp.]|nr:hypothetical protein [Hamadaea sp.]